LNKIETTKNLPYQIKKVLDYQTIFDQQIFNYIKSCFWSVKDLRKAKKEDDCKNGFDLEFEYKKKKIEMGVRIRPIEFLEYGDITLRFKTQKNNESEFHKLKNGKCNYYFFGWFKDEKIKSYIIFDVEEMRRKKMFDEEIKLIKNNDESIFVIYSIKELEEKECILYKKNIKL